MSTEPETDGPATRHGRVPGVRRSMSPKVDFCGLCGVPLTEHGAKGPGWLRLRGLQRVAR